MLALEVNHGPYNWRKNMFHLIGLGLIAYWAVTLLYFVYNQPKIEWQRLCATSFFGCFGLLVLIVGIGLSITGNFPPH